MMQWMQLPQLALTITKFFDLNVNFAHVTYGFTVAVFAHTTKSSAAVREASI